LAEEVAHLQIAARDESKLEELAARLRRQSNCEIKASRHVRDAVRGADLILTATSSIITLIEPGDVKPGAAVCDVAIPHNVGDDLIRHRNDVLVFEGGLSKIPPSYLVPDKNWKHISPDGMTIFGCLAETWILALEGQWESYSLGRGRITLDALREIEALAVRHGFELADFRYRHTLIDRERVKEIRKHAIRTRKHRGVEYVNV